MEENQELNWLDVNEVGNLSDCSVTTVRKWASKHKSNPVSNHNKTLTNLNDLHLEKTNSLIQNNKHIINKLKKILIFSIIRDQIRVKK